MSDELYSNVLNDIVAILNEDTALSRDKKIHEIMRAFIMGLCGEPEMVKAIMYSGINVIFANDSDNSTPNYPGIRVKNKVDFWVHLYKGS